jgi:putative addiction module component (TIGR02574 family)
LYYAKKPIKICVLTKVQINSMSEELTALKLRATKLPTRERAELALAMLESLDPGEDTGVEEAWKVELERREAEIDSGTAQLIPGDEVMERMRRKFG